MTSSPLRSFAVGTLAWVVGLACAVLLGMLLGVFVPGPAATIAGPLVLGLFVGLGQRHAFGVRAGRGFTLLTGAGAALGWLLGTFVAWRLHAGGHDAIAPWSNGLVVGAVVGALQSFSRRSAIPGASRERLRWLAGSVLAWGAAIGPWLAPGIPTYVRLATLVVPGIFTVVARRHFSIEASCPVIGGLPSAGGV